MITVVSTTECAVGAVGDRTGIVEAQYKVMTTANSLEEHLWYTEQFIENGGCKQSG